MEVSMPSRVTETPAADSATATAHFARRLAFETDCWDVHASLDDGSADFVVLDVRSPSLFAKGHVKGAVNIPHRELTVERLRSYAESTVFVVYCAGPHCNGANKAALRLARLGRPVKEMIGGITGWCDEGFALERGAVVSRGESAA
jgi:rhodanese-related sulfurtransferase